jgi:hypothetical protein
MPKHRIFATTFARVYPLYELAKGKTMEKILRQ